MTFTLTPEREKWATIAWQTAVSANETDAKTLDEYLESILQPLANEWLEAITDSWKPADSPAVAARREAVVTLLKEIPDEKLAIIEAELAKP